MLEILEDLVEYTLFHEYLQHFERDVPMQDHLIMTMKSLEIDYRILILQPRASTPPLEEVLRGTLILYKDDLYGTHNPTSFYHRRFADQIKQSLSRSDLFDENWQPLHESLLWILTLGVYHSNSDSWFVKKLVQVNEALHISSWSQFSSVLSRFGYIPRTFEVPMRKVWDDVEEIRSSVASLKQQTGALVYR